MFPVLNGSAKDNVLKETLYYFYMKIVEKAVVYVEFQNVLIAQILVWSFQFKLVPVHRRSSNPVQYQFQPKYASLYMCSFYWSFNENHI